MEKFVIYTQVTSFTVAAHLNIVENEILSNIEEFEGFSWKKRIVCQACPISL